MAATKCPLGNYSWGYTCMATNDKKSDEIGKNLCDTWNYEQCPIYKEVMAKK